MNIFRGKAGQLCALSMPLTLLSVGLFSHHQETQELRNAPKLGLAELTQRAAEFTGRSLPIELNGECTELGKANQKIHTTYVSSSGSPTIEGERSVFLYRLSDGTKSTTLLASETEIPLGQISVKGKLHPTQQFFDGKNQKLSEIPIFLQVELCKNESTEITCSKSISTVP